MVRACGMLVDMAKDNGHDLRGYSSTFFSLPRDISQTHQQYLDIMYKKNSLSNY
jgi:hypothetical protein